MATSIGSVLTTGFLVSVTTGSFTEVVGVSTDPGVLLLSL